jgi:prepilin-type N-terminal cleavage/methylation domain-containing protein
MTKEVSPNTCRGVCVKRLTAQIGAWHKRSHTAFTLIELIVVVAIILILAGLLLSTASYARKKGARARAETEIAALAAACENYKADNGIYPRGPATAMTIGTVTIPANVTDNLNAKTMGDPTGTTNPTYGETSLYLYTLLSGDTTGNRTPTGKSYMQFKPNMLFPADQTQSVQYIRDPFGYSYGYSTSNQVDPTHGYNPTFDLWSTSRLTATPGGNPDTITPQWVKNW